MHLTDSNKSVFDGALKNTQRVRLICSDCGKELWGWTNGAPVQSCRMIPNNLVFIKDKRTLAAIREPKMSLLISSYEEQLILRTECSVSWKCLCWPRPWRRRCQLTDWDSAALKHEHVSSEVKRLRLVEWKRIIFRMNVLYVQNFSSEKVLD